MARPNLGKLLASRAKGGSLLPRATITTPARTRFAPSPTGFIHLGSLRTALYNYLLAKSTGGQFILRLEDTDQTRLKPLAEENIYKSLQWTKILWDEGPHKQSERKEIYSEYAEKLLQNGHAYRCFCSKHRLDSLAESARQLKPPSTASYDRKCSHISAEESYSRAQKGESFVVRFKSPHRWPKFNDLLHGPVDVTTQINQADQRYDDFVLLKSDGMPTYHFANVIDDTLMRITHVIRGEEWLPSTPKHVALYNALETPPPSFVHIPLLTGAGGKKLSKRRSDQGVFEFANAPDFVGPEALVNFVALLGWSPVASSRTKIGERVSEVKSMVELERDFSLEGLTKGNIQVDFGKLYYLDKQHFERLLNTDFEEAARRCHTAFPNLDMPSTKSALTILRPHVSCVADYVQYISAVLTEPLYENVPKDHQLLRDVIESVLNCESLSSDEHWDPQTLLNTVISTHSKKANMALRYALLDGRSGTTILEALTLLGPQKTRERLQKCATQLA